jgi:hypothetical protein
MTYRAGTAALYAGGTSVPLRSSRDGPSCPSPICTGEIALGRWELGRPDAAFGWLSIGVGTVFLPIMFSLELGAE